MQVRNTEPVRIKTENGWIIHVHTSPWNDLIELYIAKEQNGHIFTVSVEKNGLCKLTELIDRTGIIEPTLVLDYEAWIGLSEALRGVAPALDKKEVDAELKATRFHLEDMRKLVFKTK